jgi:hypothetical protein
MNSREVIGKRIIGIQQQRVGQRHDLRSIDLENGARILLYGIEQEYVDPLVEAVILPPSTADAHRRYVATTNWNAASDDKLARIAAILDEPEEASREGV